MTDAAITPAPPARGPADAAARRLRKRHAAETRFKLYGRLAIIVALSFLVLLLGRVGLQGWTTFSTHRLSLPVHVDAARVDTHDLNGVNWDYLVATAGLKAVGLEDDDTGERAGQMQELMSPQLGYQLLEKIKANPALIGTTVVVEGPLRANADLYFKGAIKRSVSEENRRLKDTQLTWLDQMRQKGLIKTGFNLDFFTHSDSTEPELAGVAGALVGSALTLLVTAVLAIPIGVLAAVYLEEFAPKNRWTDIIEVNINNLAAVPSIVYGLLGLALFINTLGVPRSSPLVGGLVLALMALPTVIIATRSALKAVPPSIREAALGVGASKAQTVFHHVLPLAVPGVMTGAILGLAHALGETAPLLMVGMVAFVPGIPHSLTGAATVLPVQVYQWSTASERAFVERTAGAIIVLVVFMILMNAIAIIVRSRFERRW
jgi:phosphate transport system permease protein